MSKDHVIEAYRLQFNRLLELTLTKLNCEHTQGLLDIKDDWDHLKLAEYIVNHHNEHEPLPHMSSDMLIDLYGKDIVYNHLTVLYNAAKIYYEACNVNNTDIGIDNDTLYTCFKTLRKAIRSQSKKSFINKLSGSLPSVNDTLMLLFGHLYDFIKDNEIPHSKHLKDYLKQLVQYIETRAGDVGNIDKEDISSIFNHLGIDETTVNSFINL